MTEITWLTQDAYDRLVGELADREGPIRHEITQRIEQAREEGDLKENGGYHAAKEEQGKMEARIRTLEHILKEAQVGEAPQSKGIVEPGTIVVAIVAGDKEEFLLGSREIAEGVDIDVRSESSPLGAAIIGMKPGETTTYKAPNGRDIEVTIKDVKTFTG
jgi:transcription elongation factor GreA